MIAEIELVLEETMMRYNMDLDTEGRFDLLSRVWQYAHKYNPKKGEFSDWLQKVICWQYCKVRRIHFNEVERNKRRISLKRVRPEYNDTSFEDEENRVHLLSQIPEAEKKFLLRYFQIGGVKQSKAAGIKRGKLYYLLKNVVKRVKAKVR
jgi:hypothetical protein